MPTRRDRRVQSKFKQNPVNARAGIDAGKAIPGFKTPTAAETAEFQRTGRSPAALRVESEAAQARFAKKQAGPQIAGSQSLLPAADVIPTPQLPVVGAQPPEQELSRFQEAALGAKQLVEEGPAGALLDENATPGQRLQALSRTIPAPPSGAVLGRAPIAITPASTAVSRATSKGSLESILSSATGKLPKTVAKGTAGRIATNTVNAAKTQTWLGKAARLATNPTAVVGGIMGAVGSYPFAGFIKEEALQTVGFSTKTALENNDLQGAEEAIELQKEILDPNTWNQIFSAIPYANVLANLESFFKAARQKLEVDERELERLRSGDFAPDPERLAEEARQDERRERLNREFDERLARTRAESDARRNN